jgi:hypothetical protein
VDVAQWQKIHPACTRPWTWLSAQQEDRKCYLQVGYASALACSSLQAAPNSHQLSTHSPLNWSQVAPCVAVWLVTCTLCIIVLCLWIWFQTNYHRVACLANRGEKAFGVWRYWAAGSSALPSWGFVFKTFSEITPPVSELGSARGPFSSFYLLSAQDIDSFF